MTMRLTKTLAVIIGTVLTIHAGISAATAGTTSDACSLLTPAQVSAVLGVSVGAGEHIPGPEMCGWSQPGDTSHSGKRVVLTIFGPMGKSTPADRFANGKTPVPRITKTPASGIGDDAYYITTPGMGTGLNVKRGSSVFQIRVYGFSLNQIEATEKTLAQDVLGKM
jgi:hypothetical protein